MADYGFVYLIGHDNMPNIYKIGRTDRAPHQRVKELSSSTSVPAPFSLICYIEVENSLEVESRLHNWLSKHRVSPNREFFQHENAGFLIGLFEHYIDSLTFADVGVDEWLWSNDLGRDDVFNPYRRPTPAANEDASEASPEGNTEAA